MLCTIALFVIPVVCPESEVAFFSDDVTCQTEKDMCIMPDQKRQRSLLAKLNKEGVRLYHSLDGMGKMRAVKLFEEGEGAKIAVETAAKEMAHRQSGEYPFTKDYQQQLEERARLKPYTRRFGY